jgi:hypothetical protein
VIDALLSFAVLQLRSRVHPLLQQGLPVRVVCEDPPSHRCRLDTLRYGASCSHSLIHCHTPLTVARPRRSLSRVTHRHSALAMSYELHTLQTHITTGFAAFLLSFLRRPRPQ